MAGVLYVVATPLGNLEDITLRALRVLKEVALIAAEDTRHSRKLLEHFHISTALTSYYDHVEREKAPRLIARLQRGDSVALIADAGTPGIADPGYRLIRAAIAAGIRVVPVPGASAVMAALAAGGLPTDRFAFEGFVPARAGARRAFYAALRDEPRTTVCFEAGRRLAQSLGDLVAALGDREVVVARELTKLFEEFVRGRAAAVRDRIGNAPVRGEVTLLIGAGAGAPAAPAEDLRTAIERLRGEGVSLRDIARTLSHAGRGSHREIYRLGLDLAGRREKPALS
jgi:16S rRNA (cytidine1402-2'-O)-methyltransferase